MTNAEKQEIIEAVLAALATNSKTIAQLSPKQSLIDSDLFEVAGGSRVTYQTLRSLIREGLALESQLSNYVTGDAAMMYLAKLDTETGTVDYKESPLVMLDGFKGVNGYTPVTGDLYYENLHGFQIWIKTAGGAENGIVANPNVAYVNKNDGAIYRWTGSAMVRIGGSAVINDLTTGGEGDALSAEMGIILRGAIETLLSNLGDYAFPNGKPNISWVGSPFTITQNLTRVTSDCDYGTIYSGSQLTIHLSAIAGSTLSAVTVKMRGVDVTNDYYDATTGTIDIPSVTGDIVITAVAVYPFDAEIEFLQSSGTQWLDTGIVAGVGFRCEIKADVQAADTGWHRLLGARDANAKFAIPVGIKSTSVDGKLYTQFGVAATNAIVTSAVSVAGLHTFITQLSSDTLSFSVDGSADSVQFSPIASVLPSLSLYMFSNHREDSTVESISAKVYYCKIWNGETLLRDFIPVRVGQVGQMFDRVSGQLFTNIGTGSFTLGNDITE